VKDQFTNDARMSATRAIAARVVQRFTDGTALGSGTIRSLGQGRPFMAGRLAFAAAVVLWPSAALAINGSDLLQICETRNAPDCTRYIAGVVDTLRGQPYYAICPPGAADYGPMVDVAIKKLRDRPDIRHYNAAHAIGLALRSAFPCKKAKGVSSRR
jgi:hypothetical protein